jgi:hypothetical protein
MLENVIIAHFFLSFAQNINIIKNITEEKKKTQAKIKITYMFIYYGLRLLNERTFYNFMFLH